MCDKTILGNGGILDSISNCYKNPKNCDKAVHNYRHTLELVPDCHQTQKMCNKAVDIYTSTIKFVYECLRLRKCVMKLLILVLLHFILIRINATLKKFATELFPKVQLC